MEAIRNRRARAAKAWGLTREIVLVGSGEPVFLPGHQDQTYPFRAHAEYVWLTDREKPGCVLAYDPKEGWTDFVPAATEAQRVWEGASGEGEGVPLDGLAKWLKKRRSRPLAVLGARVKGVRSDATLAKRLREDLLAVRRPKDAEEMRRMRAAAQATAAAFARAVPLIRPGATERAIEIEIEAEFFRNGAQRTAYDTIVGTGPNSAVLHFMPTARAARDGELVLIDAGAEVDGYACDVTRTYPAGGAFTPEQKDVFAVVDEARRNGIAKCRPGVEWRDVHLGACLDIARGLADMGILRGTAEGLLEQDAQALFFPHGIGHMLGLGVRDAGGALPGRRKSKKPGIRHLRVDLPLDKGFVMTVEPGIYFIPALLTNAEKRKQYRDAVVWARVDRMLGFGGIRLEDNVHVTDAGPEVLTAAIPHVR
ncbi:MAG TPA: aminopeptidase P family protein [Planctomycetota bacterium]|nr:aminopeptidase P family protein [Planctomycetota bacterium]